MRAHGIQGAKRRGKPWRTTIPDPDARRRPGSGQARLHRRRRPNRLWVGDLSVSALLGGRRLLRVRASTCSAAVSSAGSSPATCAPTSSSTRCGWRSGPASTAPTSGWWPTPTAGSQYTSAAYTQVLDDHQRARVGRHRSATPTTTRWPNLRRLVQDRADRRPRLAHPQRSSSSPSSSTSAGSTTTACTSRSATSRPSSSKTLTLPQTRYDPSGVVSDRRC